MGIIRGFYKAKPKNVVKLRLYLHKIKKENLKEIKRNK